jgi:CRISPR/Cas system CSM-associated protein Csm3 (group 7 of RAMP superfamily)
MLALSHMAVQCSLYLHQQLEKFSIGGPAASATLTTSKSNILSLHKTNSSDKATEDVYLRTHTGLGYGEVKVYNVGGISDRWLYVLGGSAVEQLTYTVAQSGKLFARR